MSEQVSLSSVVPAPPKSVIETDTFCDGCGFNLFTQPVWRDERLGILICRCPECGKHQPAQGRSSAGTTWLNRLATVLLVGWVLATLVFVVGFFFFQVSHYAIAEEGLTIVRTETDDGREVSFDWASRTTTNPGSWQTVVQPPTTIPASQVTARRHLVAWLPGGVAESTQSYGRSADMIRTIVIVALMGVLMLLFTAFLAAISWHWKARTTLLWLMLPVLALGFVEMVSGDNTRYYSNVPVKSDRSMLQGVYIAVLIGDLLATATGLWIGRPIARIALTLLVPPKARQHFAFLWLRDGKKPPGASVVAQVKGAGPA